MKHMCIIMKTISLVFFALFLIVVMPLVINYAHKVPAVCDFFAVDWCVTDTLQFYGTFASATATIVAVYLTIRYERKKLQQQLRINANPLLYSENFPASITRIIEPHELVEYIDWDSNATLSISKTPSYDYKTAMNSYSEYERLTKEWLENALTNERKEEILNENKKQLETWMTYTRTHFILEYRLGNCGAGNANNLVFFVNDIPITKLTLLKNEKRVFVILFNSLLLHDNEFMLKMKFQYTDIYSTAVYEQVEKFRLFQDKNGLTTAQRLEWMLSEQKEV